MEVLYVWMDSGIFLTIEWQTALNGIDRESQNLYGSKWIGCTVFLCFRYYKWLPDWVQVFWYDQYYSSEDWNEVSKRKNSDPGSAWRKSNRRKSLKWRERVDRNRTFLCYSYSDSFVRLCRQTMREAPVIIQMSDYSGFEKAGSMGTSLPTSNSRITTKSGDIVLYNGNLDNIR